MSEVKLCDARIIVTGGAGFIGSHLVDALIKEKPSALAVIDNLSLGKLRNLEAAREAFAALEFYEESVADAEDFRRRVESFAPDVVFNLATVPLTASLERPYECYREIIDIGMNPLELCRLGLIDRLVHFSTSEVYGSAITEQIDESHPRGAHTPYASAKAANDNLIDAYRKSFGTRVLVIRPFNNYGPRQNEGSYAGVIPKTIKSLLEGKGALIFGDGKQTRDFIYVGDCVRAVVSAAKNDELYGLDVNVGAGREVAIGWLVEEICRQVAPDVIAEKLPERAGDVRRHLADTSRIEAVIGQIAKTSFEEGLARTVAWYKEKLNNSDES